MAVRSLTLSMSFLILSCKPLNNLENSALHLVSSDRRDDEGSSEENSGGELLLAPPTDPTIEALSEATSSDKLKKAVLQVAYERAQAARIAGQTTYADNLQRDITNALSASSASMANPNRSAPNLSVLRPVTVKNNNPYLNALVAKADKDLSIADGAWPLATASKRVLTGLYGTFGVREAADIMRDYLWLIAHPDSPKNSNPELLRRFLRRAHAFIDAYALDSNSAVFYRSFEWDQFSVESATEALVEFIKLYPGLLLPTQKVEWDRSIRSHAANLWNALKTANQWNLNIETARMVGLLHCAYYVNDQTMKNKVFSHVDAVIRKMYPDGGWPYNGGSNPSVNYHLQLVQSLTRIYDASNYTPIRTALGNSQWKGPVMGRTDEFWTSPFHKTYRWNYALGTEAGNEAVAAISGNRFVRWLLNRQVVPASRTDIAWYNNTVSPRALPDNYTVFDRNIAGPRAWYGRWNYAATLRTIPASEAGHETVMGAMTVDDPDGRVNSILVDVTPRVRIFDKDQLDGSGNVTETADTRLTTSWVGTTTVGRQFSASSASATLTTIKNDAYQGTVSRWKGRQVWLGLSDRIIGLISTVPTIENAPAYGVTNVLRFISGGTAGAAVTKTMQQLADNQFQYGELSIKVHQLWGYSKVESVLLPYRVKSYPATELTIGESRGLNNISNTNLSYPLNSNFMSVVEVRPTWVTSDATKVARLQRSDGVLALQVAVGAKMYSIWFNPSPTTIVKIGTAVGLISGVKSSIRISSVNGGQPSTTIPTYPELKPGQQMVIVTSPDASDHLAGWASFQVMDGVR